VARRLAVGDEDELLCFGPPAVELRCRGRAQPELIERQLAAA